MSFQRRRVLWLWPGRNWERSREIADALLAEQAEVTPAGLLLWTASPPQPYTLDAEAAAVWRAVDRCQWHDADLVGFSAGATVVLVAALLQPERVRTLTLIEPATIGADAWSASEAAFATAVAEVRRLPVEQRLGGFARLASAADEPLLSEPVGTWDARVDLLEDALAEPGFVSLDLANLVQPTLVFSGARSNRRFVDVANRIAEVMPVVEHVVIPNLNHMHLRQALPEITDALQEFWSRDELGS